MGYPAVCKRLTDALSGNVYKRDSYRPTRESINSSQKVFEPVRSRKCNEIQIQVFKSSVRNCKITNRGSNVTGNFCLLTTQTLSCPFTTICSHTRPDHLTRDSLSSPFHPGMSQAVENIKDAFSEGKRDVRSRGSIRDVDENVAVTNVYTLPV